LASGEPNNQLAKDYGLTPSSLHRHRANCLKLGSSSAIMKTSAQGSAALALLPSPQKLGESYSGLIDQIEKISQQAKAEGSLRVAIAGLNSLRQTLDSLSRLAAREVPDSGVADRKAVDLDRIVAALIDAFDQEPAVKQKVARILVEIDNEQSA
jgi:hypothetical protein